MTRYCLLIQLAILLLTHPALSTEPTPDYSQLKTLIETAHNRRRKLLDNSTGTVHFTIKTNNLTTMMLETQTPNKNYTDNFNYHLDDNYFTQIGQCSIQWYKKQTKNRYEITNIPQPEKDKTPTRTLPNKRVLITDHKEISYNLDTQKADIKPTRKQAANPLAVILNFDINSCYKLNHHGTIVDILNANGKAGQTTPKITTVTLNGLKCIKLEYSGQRKLKNNKIRKTKTCLWISPQRSYSVIRSQIFSNTFTGYNELKLISSYDAAYEPAPNHKDIWLLKTFRRYARGTQEELLLAEFQNTKIAINLPEKTFTTQAASIPPESTIRN